MTVTTPATRNMITDYYDVIASAVRRCGAVPGDAPGTPGFAPGFDLPELTPRYASSTPPPRSAGPRWATTAGTT